MDSIVKLPLSRGYNVCSDTSLSQFITQGINMQDHQIVIVDKSSNYIKATVLLPYEAIIKVPEIAAFKQHTHFPDKVSSKAIIGKDACLDLLLLKKLCKQLKKEQVELLAHQQTNKWVEETNQSVETALRVFDKFRQNDWSEWLPLIHYQTNSMLPSIMEETPHESWMGFAPHVQKTEKSDPLSGTRKQTKNPQITRFQVQKAMRRARGLRSKQTKWTPYIKGQKVWSEGTHLSTSHLFVELRPKRLGPFQITGILGSVMYRLNLPEKWKIHNTFHATLLSPYVETEKYGVNFTEPPPDLIRNKPKKEGGEIPLWQQCHDKLREKERQPKISVLKNIEQSCETQKELGNKKCIKDFHLSEAITSPAHSYMHGFLHTHRQRCSVGRDTMRPSGLPSDIPQVEPTGTPHLPCQPRSATTVATVPLCGEDLWPALTAATSSSNGSLRGTDPTLEPNQSSPDTREKEANVPGAPPFNPEASQHQPAVLEARTKDPLVDEETSLVIIRLPLRLFTSHERHAAHLPHLEYPLIRMCHSIPRPRNVILQAPCNLSIPWVMELRTCDLPHWGFTEYQPQGQEADL